MTDREGSIQWSMMPADVLPFPAPETREGFVDFGRVFEVEFDYVWRSLRRLGIAERDLEDVTHDVFLRVFQHISQYDTGRPIRPWLFGFAFRIASDHRRGARNRLEVLDPAADRPDPERSAVDRLVRAEALRTAQALLDTIEFDRRAVFILHELDGFSIPKVAEALAIPLNTAYSRLRLAREEFEKAAARLRLRADRGDR
jgi:RNA polymerase sigma-70 factor, ECF subfamily